jgi:uncharacterized repeat protein (TIGR02543 family)
MNMKQQVKKSFFFSLLIIACSLFFTLSCSEPLQPVDGQKYEKPDTSGQGSYAPSDIPPDKGAFFLTIADVEGSARTILPAAPDKESINVYELTFSKSGTVVYSPVLTPNTLSSPVYLDPGTYNLDVTAYIGPGRSKPVARGSGTNIVIGAGASSNITVILYAIISGATEKGTFSWDIGLPDGLSKADMVVTLPNQSTSEILSINLLEGSNNKSSVSLNPGYYQVTFTLGKEGTKDAVRRDILHVYQNMESSFNFDFTDAHLARQQRTVTFVYNGADDAPESEERDVDYNTTTTSLSVQKTGFVFGGWYTTSNFSGTEFDFDATPIIDDITLYAKWKKPLTIAFPADSVILYAKGSALTPLEGEHMAFFPVEVSGFTDTADAASVALVITNVTGLTISSDVVTTSGGKKTFNVTVQYPGTQTFASGEAAISVTGINGETDDYFFSGSTVTRNIAIRDGQAAFNGGANEVDRRIPVNQGNVTQFNAYACTVVGLTRHYRQIEPITLTGSNNWTAIYAEETGDSFSGSYDGGGFSISGMNINKPDDGGQGMFESLIGGKVKNLSLLNVDITGMSNVGAVAGSMSAGGEISNCYVTGNVTGTAASVGGIVGEVYGESNISIVRNCHSAADVTGLEFVGGISPYIEPGNIVEYCYSTGKVIGINYVGGIVGRNMGTVSSCIALNQSVINSANNSNTDFGRVVGLNYSGNTLTNNRAYSGMELPSGVTAVSNPNGIHGADITGSDAKTLTTWSNASPNGAGFDFTGVWEWSENSVYMPRLRSMSEWQSWPDYLYDLVIKTPNDLAAFAQSVNNGNNFSGQTIMLANNIDISGIANWTPIGTSTNRFTGIFEGKGFSIDGLVINSSAGDYQGLFGYIGSGGAVKNLALKNVNITGKDYIGGVAGFNSGVVEKCYVSGEITGNNNVGGLVGRNSEDNSAINNSYSTCKVTGNEEVGGIAGYLYGNQTPGANTPSSINNCYSTGQVSGVNHVGGIAGGGTWSSIKHCYSISKVTADNQRAGSIIGYSNWVEIRYCTGLSPEVNAPSYAGNVIGQHGSLGMVSEIYARDDMLINGAATGAGSGMPTQLSVLKNAAWWTNPANWASNEWDFTAIWEWNAATNLPILKNMPGGTGIQNHTLPPVIQNTVYVSKDSGEPEGYENLTDALAVINNSEAPSSPTTYNVTLLRDQTLETGSMLAINNANKNIVLTGSGVNRTIQLNGVYFWISSGSLTLGENITLKGISTGDNPLVGVTDTGAFNMNGNSKITGHYNSGANFSHGTVHVAGGTFTMSGGEISDNSGLNGGGVYVDSGTFNMTGGTITGNSVTSGNGGGVYFGGGTFTVGGNAKIYGNTKGAERNNVYFNSNTLRFSIATAPNAPTNDMEIWVSHATTTENVQITNNYGNAANFRADDKNKTIYVQGSLYIVDAACTVRKEGVDGEIGYRTVNMAFASITEQGTYTVTAISLDNDTLYNSTPMILNVPNTIITFECSANGERSIIPTGGVPGTMFTLGSGVKLTIGNNIKLTGNSINNATFVMVNSGAEFVMTGGSVSNTGTADDVNIASGGTLNLSGASMIGTLTLSANTSINIPSAWNGSVTSLKLQGDAADWEGEQIVTGANTGLISAAISQIILAPSLNAYYINSSGYLVEKQGITFTIPPFGAGQPEINSGVTLSRTEANEYSNSAEFIVPNAENYSSIEWYYGVSKLNDSATATKQAALIVTVGGTPLKPYDILSNPTPQTITVEVVTTGGQFYTVDITFMVVP